MLDLILYKLYVWFIDNVLLTIIAIILTGVAFALFIKTGTVLLPVGLICLWLAPLTFRLMGLNKYSNAYEPVVVINNEKDHEKNN